MYRKYGGNGVFAVLLLWNWAAKNCPSTGRLEKMKREDILDVACVDAEKVTFIDDLVAFEFLGLDGDTYFLPNWADEQPYVANAEERSRAAREKAEKRWGSKSAASEEGKQCGGNAAALQGQSSNTNTNAFKSPPSPPEGEEVTVNEVVELYRQTLPELPEPHEVTAKLGRDIRSAANASPERANPDWWRRYFGLVRESPLLMGEGKSGWRASLGWLVCRANMAKVLAGEYPAREGGSAPAAMSEEEYEAMRAQGGPEARVAPG
jgi:hypothetical protein